MQNNTVMTKLLLKSLQDRVPTARFMAGKTFYWSPKTNEVFYRKEALETEVGTWSLLHETAHAQLGHADYNNDVTLLSLEVEAWQKAKQTATDLNITIDEDHIQECLDTYRDWLYARSTCPTCRLNSLQIGDRTYQCLNCRTLWSVSRSRFCRPYRMHATHKTPSL